LRRAHETGSEATDDAGLVESLGATVRVVRGEPRNIKVTTAADLEVAQALAMA
jgi:2-C-methyl-D-erythritol 4-phosphate cytidylyltransferase